VGDTLRKVKPGDRLAIAAGTFDILNFAGPES